MDVHGQAREMIFRPMPLLSVLSLASLVTLIMLGNWQYDRYADKSSDESVEAQLESSTEITLSIDVARDVAAQQVYGKADGEPIWRRYAPARLDGTDEIVLVMVEATGGATPLPVAVSSLPETQSFDGVVREARASESYFGTRDQPEDNIWYTVRADQMAKQFGLDGEPRIAEPIIMTVRNRDNLSLSRQTPNPYAFAKPLDPLPPERHFGYALTWWGMAVGLFGVYVALHHARGRLRFKKA